MERFNPADASNCLKEGEADLQIANCVAHKSKTTGKDMLKFDFKARDINGKVGYITFYVTEVWQVKKIFECFNLDMDKFNTGEVLATYYVANADKKGKAIVKTESSPRYDDKTVINKFLKHASLMDATTTKSANTVKYDAPAFNDDIPF